MQKDKILSLLSEWSVELDESLVKSNSLCVALFSTDKQLLFSNEAFDALSNTEPSQSFLNPSFDELLRLENASSLIFDGYVTFVDHNAVNPSIAAQIYRKQDMLLLIGGVDTSQLLAQNWAMHQLNREINTLQRDLITKTHALENTLSQLNETNFELNKLNADKDRFIQILGHDLRSPFTTLLGFSDILLENLRVYNIDQIENLIHILHKTTLQTFHLLEDLLLWSRSQTGRISFEPRKMVFHELCLQVVDVLMNTAVVKNITINFPEDKNTMIFGDEQMLKTILRNLLSNAIKFTPQKGQINISVENGQSNTTITVSDNGVGIEKENIEKIWDVTQHYVTTGTAKEKGTGLGLMLCKELVEKHGGTIWVESEPAKGSHFYFTIPLHND